MGRLPGSWDPPAWSGPWKGLLLAASVLSSCLQPVPAQTPTPTPVTITPASPALGGNVSLAPQNVAQNFTSCNWHRSTTNDETSRILTYFPPPNPVQHNGPAHTGRETAGPGCALHIAGLTLSDTGNYTHRPRTDSPSLPSESLSLTPCPIAQRARSMAWAGNADTVLWLRDGASLVPSDRLVLSSDNRTLNVLNVTRGDAGAYQCEVGNPVSSIRSEPRTRSNALSVPCTEMLPRPTVTPNQTLVLENGTFTLRCNSSPSADTVLWLRDGASLTPSERLVLSPDNRTLTVLGVTRSDGGTYQCEVGNPVSTNRSEDLSRALSFPLIPSLFPSYCWGLNGTDTNQTGSSLTFNPMTLDHQGTYECWAHNPITNRTVLVSVTAVWAGPASHMRVPLLVPLLLPCATV
uniref:Ig-like domain-containing protein n=1 Tax=Chelonoidis abingdonii TaxID=106734 RepID=A0A8C0GDE6_CHEAB